MGEKDGQFGGTGYLPDRGKGAGGCYRAVHHCAPHVSNWDDAFLLAVHRFREQPKGFLDLGLLLRSYVVLLGEFRLPGSLCAGFRRRRGGPAFNGLEGIRVSNHLSGSPDPV